VEYAGDRDALYCAIELTDKACLLDPITSILFRSNLLYGFEVGEFVHNRKWNDGHHPMNDLRSFKHGANMGEVIRFIPKSERERLRLIQEARARYHSIFPPADPIGEQLEETGVSNTSGQNTQRSDEVLPS
jgi:hypothetical protein